MINKGFLKGKKTYVADLVLVVVAIQGLVPKLNVIPKDYTAIVVAVLGLVVAYCRSRA